MPDLSNDALDALTLKIVRDEYTFWYTTRRVASAIYPQPEPEITAGWVRDWSEWHTYGDGSPVANRLQAKAWRKVVGRIRSSLERSRRAGLLRRSIGYIGRVETKCYDPICN